MLKLLQSIFGFEENAGAYPASVITKAIERAVDGTDPWLRSVPGYHKKLMPSVTRAIDYVVSLVDALPPALQVRPARYADDRLLKAIFISASEMRDVLLNDRSLKEFLKGSQDAADRVTALMFMEKQEHRAFGCEMSGDALVRDVPQVTVCFDAHRLMDPAAREDETRLRLKKRAYDYLVRIALQHLTAAKGQRKELERQSALLQSKLEMLRRGGWGFDGSAPAPGEDMGMLEHRLGQVESQLLELEGGGMLDSYLETVADVLGHPEGYLRSGQEKVILDSMRIKRERPDVNTVELSLFTLADAEGRGYAIQLISMPVPDLRGLTEA